MKETGEDYKLTFVGMLSGASFGPLGSVVGCP